MVLIETHEVPTICRLRFDAEPHLNQVDGRQTYELGTNDLSGSALRTGSAAYLPTVTRFGDTARNTNLLV
jgi:hypothetical protein